MAFNDGLRAAGDRELNQLSSSRLRSTGARGRPPGEKRPPAEGSRVCRALIDYLSGKDRDTAMKCPRCGAASPTDKKFCGDCGAALTQDAGTPVAGGDDRRASVHARSAPSEAERRPLTLAFCDLAGSTRLSTELDPEDLREVIAAYHRCVAETIERYGGFVAKYMGDGVLVYFGYPHAREDDAARAVAAALALVEAVGKLRLAVIVEPLRIRVGVATGDVVVGDLIGTGAAREQIVVGTTPNLAARLQALAEPDAVVISSDTRRVAAGRFEYHDLGTVEVRGFPEPVRAWQVVRPSAIESRFEALHADARTPLVGRERQVDLLLRCWTQAKLGRGRVVLLPGEPGIGKSRIVADMIEHLSGETFSHLRFFCSPDHVDSALHPLVARIERAADLRRDDASDRKLEKLEAFFSSSRGKSDDVALLADLLSVRADGRSPALELSPEQKKEKTRTALVAQFERLAAQQPVLMLCEDVQWIDPTSLELLGRLVDRVAALPAMIVVTFRPEFEPPWTGRPHLVVQPLGRLGRQDAGRIIGHLTRGRTLPPKVTEQILERTDGVPLFVEELTKMVLESGLLHEENGGLVLRGSLPPLAVPPTLQASLVARLDRLGPVKEVAQAAAAIGREFTVEMLAFVFSRPERELQASLDQLADAGLVFEHGARPRSSYVFKHALVQDAAYGTLLRSRRRHLHGRIGDGLEAHFPEIAAAQPEIVARHYTEAGMAAKAIGYWLKAGHLAGARSAAVEARHHLAKGLALVQGLPPGRERDRQELTFLSLLGPALIATKGHAAPEPSAAYRRAVELIETTGDTARQDSVYFGLFSIYYNQAKFAEALELARAFLRLAEQRNEATSRVIALGMVAGLHNVFGEFASARDRVVQAVPLLATMRHGQSEWRYTTDIGVSGKVQLAIPLWHLGFPDQSIALERDALDAAERMNHQVTTALVLSFGALSAFRRRDLHELRQSAARMQAFAREHSLTQLSAWGTCLEGAAIAASDPVEAIARIKSGIGLCEKIKNPVFRPIWLIGLAEAQLAAGRAEEALQTVDAALALAEQTRERWMNAELWRLRGCIVLRLGCSSGEKDAEACFSHALACADAQQSKMLALRAATSLAGLWERQRLRGKAREFLAAHYNSVAEGLDTPDMTEARSLLDALQ
jgi:class 3 adenylate cyclase/predicted ATPase